MLQKLRGIIPPLVTPLKNDRELDLNGLENLIEHVVSGGVHGIFILGTTGEAQSLGFDLRMQMVRASARILNRRLPLLVGISDTSVEDSVKLAGIAKKNGADAVVSAPPYYYATGQSELIEFYEKLLIDLPLPLYLYNMPTHTKVSFAPQTVRIISENRKVVGFKDSSANGTYFQTVAYEMRNRENFSIFVGPEEMTAEVVLMGADGGVNGGANIFPKLYVDLYNAATEQNINRVRDLQQKVMQVSSTIYNHGQYGSSYLKGVKTALSILGICEDHLATPFNKFDQLRRNKIAQAIIDLKLSDPIEVASA